MKGVKNTEGKKIALWERFTNWVIKAFYPKFAKYYKKLPHLSSSITKFLARITVFLFILNLYLSFIFGLGLIAFSIFTSLVSVTIPAYNPFMGMDSVLMLVYLLAFIILGFSSKADIENYTKRGWEYLFALFILGVLFLIVKALIRTSIGAFFSTMYIVIILRYLLGLVIALYLLFEIKVEFNK